MHIRVGDTVEVICGDDKGTRGKVMRMLKSEGKLIVEGVNRVYKHMKPSRQNPQGGRLSKEMPVDISNVMVIDPTTNQKTRVGYRYLPDGSKERYAKKSGASMGVISRPRPRYAKKA